MENKERLVFADYLRVVACFLVMLVHSSENFYAADASGLAGNVSMLANDANRFWVAFYDGGGANLCAAFHDGFGFSACAHEAGRNNGGVL